MSQSHAFAMGRLIAAAAIAALAGQALGQTGHNTCSMAPIIGDGTFTGTTSGSTNDGTGSCGASASSPDVWFHYVAPMDGQLQVDTCGGSSYDTVLGLFDACGGAELACNDDSCGLQSTVIATVEEGDDIWIRVSGFAGGTGSYTMTVTTGEGGPGGGTGADVILSNITSISHYTPVGGVHGYFIDSYTCNIGTADLLWGNSWGGTPAVAANGYRLHDGRLMQLGTGWVKHSCCAAAGNGCGIGCNGHGGSVLGIGCLDIYGSGYNGSQGLLGPRSNINPITGTIGPVTGGSGNTIYKRLQIPQTDMMAANYPGALYFIEGVYVGTDDAASGNALNNATYRRVTISPTYDLATTGATYAMIPAIYAWRDHGNGVGVPDNTVEIQQVDIPDEGTFFVGSKVTDNGDGTWHYEYAVYNINSHQAGGSFSVPVPAGASVSNIGFHDVDYHSGEPFSNTDWNSSHAAGAVTWSSPETFAQNQNSNALRWGTMYNFWFDSDAAPGEATATLGLFRPGDVDGADFLLTSPTAPPCLGDYNGDGVRNTADFFEFFADFFADPPNADYNNDGATNTSDFFEFFADFFGPPCA